MPSPKKEATRLPLPKPRELASAVALGVKVASASQGLLAPGFAASAIGAAGSPSRRAAVAAWILASCAQNGQIECAGNPEALGLGKIKIETALEWAALAQPFWRTEAGAAPLRLASSAGNGEISAFIREALSGWKPQERLAQARRLSHERALPGEAHGDSPALGEGLEPLLREALRDPASANEAIALLCKPWASPGRGPGWQFAWLADDAAQAPAPERLAALRLGIAAWPLHAMGVQLSAACPAAWSAALADPALAAGWGKEKWESLIEEYWAAELPSDPEDDDVFEGRRRRGERRRDGVDGARAPSALWRAARAEPDFWGEAFWGQPAFKLLPSFTQREREQIPYSPVGQTRWERFLGLAAVAGKGWPVDELASWKPGAAEASLPLDCWAAICENGSWLGQSDCAARAGSAWRIEAAREKTWSGRLASFLPITRDGALEPLRRRALEFAAAQEGPWADWDPQPNEGSLPGALLQLARGQSPHAQAATASLEFHHAKNAIGQETMLEGLKALARSGFDFDAPRGKGRLDLERLAAAPSPSFAKLWGEAAGVWARNVSSAQSSWANFQKTRAENENAEAFWAEWGDKALLAARLEKEARPSAEAAPDWSRPQAGPTRKSARRV